MTATFRETLDKHIWAALDTLALQGDLCGMPHKETADAAEAAVHEWLIAEFMDWADNERGPGDLNGAEAVDVLIQKIKPTRPASSK